MERLTASQLAEWEAYSLIEPFSNYKHDYELAYLLSTITNLFIGAYGKKGARLTNPEEFIIGWGEDSKEVKKQSFSDMKKTLLSIAAQQNKKVEAQKRR